MHRCFEVGFEVSRLLWIFDFHSFCETRRIKIKGSYVFVSYLVLVERIFDSVYDFIN